MKRLTVLVVCLILAALSTTFQPVYAATPTYARAAVRTAYFFTDKSNSSSIFAVPYTYCVEVLREEGDWYYVRYAADTGVYKSLYGYCRKADFTLEDGTPAVTYLYKTVTVNYTVSSGGSSLPVLGEIALEAAYYGTYYAGATVYSYVYCQGSFGYIEGANDDYPLNIPEETPPQGSTDNPADGTEKKPVSAALIAFLVIAALLVITVLVIFFTTHHPRPTA